MKVGRVLQLSVRSARTRVCGSQAAPLVLAVAGLGLAGDVHADALSPRQVLLASAAPYARHGLQAHALDENLLVDIDTAALRSGSLLRVGAHAVLWLSFQCEPCGHLDQQKRGLSRSIARNRGMLARVWAGGEIAVGDAIVQLAETMPPWSEDWRERVRHVLLTVPDGMAVEYRQLARLSGVAPGYCRVFPRIARELGLAHKAVAMSAHPEQARWMGEDYFLSRESRARD